MPAVNNNQTVALKATAATAGISGWDSFRIDPFLTIGLAYAVFVTGSLLMHIAFRYRAWRKASPSALQDKNTLKDHTDKK
jgi:hypothetical protein